MATWFWALLNYHDLFCLTNRTCKRYGALENAITSCHTEYRNIAQLIVHPLIANASTPVKRKCPYVIKGALQMGKTSNMLSHPTMNGICCPPNILGQEAIRIVEEVGPKVRTLKAGDRVIILPVIACGSCDYCQREEYSLCGNTNPSKEMEAA
jgi:hypothetical protein